MNLFDVNVLVYAFRRDSERHSEYRAWLLDVLAAQGAFGISERVLAAVVRITTHPKIFEQPSTLDEVFEFTAALRAHPGCRRITPSAGHWERYESLCRQVKARGNLSSDAWLAALALDSGCTWVTTDRDFARFPGLVWRHPLDSRGPIENPA